MKKASIPQKTKLNACGLIGRMLGSYLKKILSSYNEFLAIAIHSRNCLYVGYLLKNQIVYMISGSTWFQVDGEMKEYINKKQAKLELPTLIYIVFCS